MNALATESHIGKAFFSSPCLCASVAIFFHGKETLNFYFVNDSDRP